MRPERPFRRHGRKVLRWWRWCTVERSQVVLSRSQGTDWLQALPEPTCGSTRCTCSGPSVPLRRMDVGSCGAGVKLQPPSASASAKPSSLVLPSRRMPCWTSTSREWLKQSTLLFHALRACCSYLDMEVGDGEGDYVSLDEERRCRWSSSRRYGCGTKARWGGTWVRAVSRYILVCLERQRGWERTAGDFAGNQRDVTGMCFFFSLECSFLFLKNTKKMKKWAFFQKLFPSCLPPPARRGLPCVTPPWRSNSLSRLNRTVFLALFELSFLP